MNIPKEFLFRTVAWVMVASAIYFYEVHKLGPMLSLGIGAFAIFFIDFKTMMGWKNSLLWLSLDTLYLILAWEAARMLIFAKLHS